VAATANAKYGGERPALARRLPDLSGLRVLDVGCGGGGFAPQLRKAGAAYVQGVEIDPASAEIAGNLCDDVINDSIEGALNGPLAGTSWDFIVLADVLEHLVDPWTVMSEIGGIVAPGGRILVSIPNVAHKTVLAQLIKHRDWRFDESGMFDRTHLRWFGRKSLENLIDLSGTEPDSWGGLVQFGVGRLQYERDVEDLGKWPLVSIYQFHVLTRRLDG
jgi:SAM-dependent methyltransferase